MVSVKFYLVALRLAKQLREKDCFATMQVMAAPSSPWILHESHMPDSLRQWAHRLRDYAPGLDGKRYGKRRTDNHLFWGGLPGLPWLLGVAFGVAVCAEMAFWRNLPSVHWGDSEDVAWIAGALVGGMVLLLSVGLWLWRRGQSSFGYYWYVTPQYIVASCYDHLKIYPIALVTKVETGAQYTQGLVRVYLPGFVLQLQTSGWPTALALSQQLKRWVEKNAETVVAPEEDVDYPLPEGIQWESWHRSRPPRAWHWGGLLFVAFTTLLFWQWLQRDVFPTYRQKELYQKAAAFLEPSSASPSSDDTFSSEPSSQTSSSLPSSPEDEEIVFQALQQTMREQEQQLRRPTPLFQPVPFFRKWHGQLQHYLQTFPDGNHRRDVLNRLKTLDHQLFAYAKGRLDDTLVLYEELFGTAGFHHTEWEQTMLDRLPRTAAYLEKTLFCTEAETKANTCLRDTWVALLRALHQKHTRTVAVSFSFSTPNVLQFLSEKIQNKQPYPPGLVGFDVYSDAFSDNIQVLARQALHNALRHWIPGILLEVVEAKEAEDSPPRVSLQVTGDFFLGVAPYEPHPALPGLQFPYRLDWMGTIAGKNIPLFSFVAEEKPPHYNYDLFLRKVYVSDELFANLLQDLRRKGMLAGKSINPAEEKLR